MAVGDQLVPSGKPYLARVIEDALESRRPPEMLSRTAAVYLAPNLDFELYGQVSGYIYEVRAEGRPQQHDVHWIGGLQRSQQKKDMTFPPIEWLDWTKKNLDYLCANYWYGEPSISPVWEFLVPSAVITRLLGRNRT